MAKKHSLRPNQAESMSGVMHAPRATAMTDDLARAEIVIEAALVNGRGVGAVRARGVRMGADVDRRAQRR